MSLEYDESRQPKRREKEIEKVLYIGANFAKLAGMTWHGLSTPHVPYIGAALRSHARYFFFGWKRAFH